MKEGYEKPTITFTTFELDTTVCGCGAGANAGGWYGKPQQGNPIDCYFGTDDGVGMFSDDPSSVCARNKNDAIDEIPKDADGDSYCYHLPSDDRKIFAS